MKEMSNLPKKARFIIVNIKELRRRMDTQSKKLEVLNKELEGGFLEAQW